MIEENFEKEFLNFCKKYDKLFEIDEKRVSNVIKDISSIPNLSSVDNYFHILSKDDHLLNALDILNKKDILKASLTNITYFMIDIILFSSLVPVRFEKGDIRRTLDILTINQTQNILLKIGSGIPTTLNYIIYQLLSEKYLSLPLGKRILIISCLNLNPKIIDIIWNDKLFQKELQRDDLIEWIFCETGKFQQHYLNSCVGETYTQFTLSHSKSFGFYIYFLKGLLEHCKEITKALGDEKKKEYAENLIIEVEKNCIELEKDVNETLDKKYVIKQEILDLIQAWSIYLQDLTMILDVDNMGARTPNCIKSSYAIGGAFSAFGLTIDFVLSSVSSKKGKTPEIMMYTQGVEHQEMCRIGSNYISCDCKSPKFNDRWILNPKDSEKEMEKLWYTIIKLGGIPMNRMDWGFGHQMFLKAGPQYLFYVGDPLYIGYQKMNYQELVKYIIDKKGGF